MAKTKARVVPQKKTAAPAAPTPPHKDGLRETVESVVIAFVLAFLFRAFEAEAFVIPTGSMAPTLMGVHKDLECGKCGMSYRVSASDELDEESEQLRARMADGRLSDIERHNAAGALAMRDIVAGICPNCRYQMDIDLQKRENAKFPTYKGDRILVAKFPYDFSDPARWDVVVFKYPITANQNFIKRCVGLPNENLVIHGGNIYRGEPEDDAKLFIERKPPDKVRAIMQIVYDNDFVVPDLVMAGLPLRWQAVDTRSGGAWQALDGDQIYRTDGSSADETWLGYQHRIPAQSDWRRYSQTGQFPEVKPQLITDFYAYNAGSHRESQQGIDGDPGLNWVGDLILECELTCEPSANNDAQVTLRLVKGGRTFDCRIDVATGQAHVWIDGQDLGNAAETGIRPGRSHRISWANVDCRLLLWVDGDLVHFAQDAVYEPTANVIPTVEDLTPARIGSRGAAVEVSHLRLLRDVYYIACRDTAFGMTDYKISLFGGNRKISEAEVVAFMSTPSAWPRAFSDLREVEFRLGSDEFLMLGDNSPRSKDSRLWMENRRPEPYVKRDLLVGKAVFVYWPHSWNRIPGTRIPFPFFPNFARMKFVR